MFSKLWILAAAALPLVANAGPPMKTSTCSSSINIRAPRNGGGAFLDEKCETGYVLPPMNGTIEFQAAPPTASTADCQRVALLEQSLVQLTDRLKRLTDSANPGHSNGGGSTIGGGGGGIGGGSNGEQQQPNPQDLEKIKKDSEEIRQLIANLDRDSAPFLSTEGLVGHVTYTLDQDGMVAEYARLNPQIRSWVRLPLEKAYMSIETKGDKVKIPGTALIDSSIPGLNKLGDEEGTPPENSIYFGSALGGSLRFNTKYACMMMNKYGARLNQTMRSSELGRHLAVNVTYAYGINVRRQYYAKYDFQKLFEQIATQTQTGGFLSTKTVNELIQRNESNSWFTFRSTSDDTRFPNDVLVQQLKAEMIDRVLQQIAIGSVPGSGTLPSRLEPGKKGADVAADGLKKCPYLYCQVAGYVLDFVSATFGSSQAVQRFLSTVGSSSEENISEEKTLRFIGTSGFKDNL